MIYIHKNKQQLGPFDENTITQMLNSNQLSPLDMACPHGGSEWKPLMIVIDEGHPESANIERESKLYDVYSEEMTSILQHWSEADDGTTKQLKKQYEQKLQIAERHVNSLKQQYPNVFEVRIMEADVLYKKAMLKMNDRGFFNNASGVLQARGNRKRSLTSTSLSLAAKLVANQQEKNNAIEAIRLLDQSISLFDTPGVRYMKAHILHFLKQNESALQELNYIIANFQNDEMYIPARQLKDEIENPPKKGMCFLATAAYGSPLAPEVKIFQQFRDETLLKSKIGEGFVHYYYQFSPPIAAFIAQWSFLRAIVRILFLSPMLKILKTRKPKIVKNIYGLLLLVLPVCLFQSISIQAQKRAPSKPVVVVTQPRQISPVAKTETRDEEKSLNNSGIIRMVKGGFGESVILNAIQTNETQFDVSMNGLFELKNASVSQKIIEAMQSTVAGKRQVQVQKIANPIPQQSSQPARSDTANRNAFADNQGLPIFGTVTDIKGFNRVYISVENAQSRERIVTALGKDPQYQIVNDPQDAQIFLEYKVLSRDSTVDNGDRDLRIKSQMNAVVIKDNKRVIAWSDTVDHVRKTLGGFGFRSTHNEIKLTERFLKALKQ